MARGGGFEPPWDKSHWISNPTQWPDYATPANLSRQTARIRQLRLGTNIKVTMQMLNREY